MSGREPVEGDPRRENHKADDLGKIRDYLGSSAAGYDSLPDGLPDGLDEGPPAAGEAPKPANNVAHDRFDHRLYSELHEACEAIRKLAGRQEAFETFPELLSDFFYSFYKAAPRLIEADGVQQRSSRANRPFVERLLEDDQTRQTRLHTRLDDMSAALAALAAGEKVLEEIESRPELADFIQRATAPLEDDGTKNAGTKEEEDDGPGQQEPAEDGSEDSDRKKKGPPEQPAPPAAPPRDLRRAVRAAAEAGAEDAEATEEALDGWGLTPADLARVPLGERIELARSLRNPRFKRLFDLVGRMRNLARAQSSQKVRSRQDEIHSVELSGDLSRLLPAELAAGLASSSRARKLDFYRRFIEGEVLSYELTADEPQAKEPIVAAIDCSASMEGHKMEWATAVCLALVDLAGGAGNGAGSSGRRPVALVFFNEAVKKVVRFPPSELRDPSKLLEVATVGASGGTRYEPAWEALFGLRGEHAYESGADMLFVTDGLCRVSEPFAGWIREEKTRTGTTVYSVLIGSQDTHELERYSDQVWSTRDLAAAGTPGEIAGEVFDRLT